MKILTHHLGNRQIIELQSETIILATVQDGLDLVGMALGDRASGLIIHKQNISATFFDLKTQLAGEILQKFSTYNLRLAIVGDFSQVTPKSLHDFIYESNRARRINFVPTVEEALNALSK